MEEILSQGEIDQLLNALNEGTISSVAEPGVSGTGQVPKRFDFRQPNKFSKDHIRTLFMVHENFCRSVGSFLSTYLRASVQAEVETVQQLTYEDFSTSLPMPTVLTMINPQPLSGTMILESNWSFVSTVIDLLFGGQGQASGSSRELTDIELGVVRRLYTHLLEAYGYAWGDIEPLKPEIESMESSLQYGQVLSPSETVCVISILIRIQGNAGRLNFCLPFIVLEPLLSKLNSRYYFNPEADMEGNRRLLEACMRPVPLDLCAVLGRGEITVRDLLDLQEGDVLPLRAHVGQDLELLVSGYPRFLVQPGIMGRNLAVQVTGLYESE